MAAEAAAAAGATPAGGQKATGTHRRRFSGVRVTVFRIMKHEPTGGVDRRWRYVRGIISGFDRFIVSASCNCTCRQRGPTLIQENKFRNKYHSISLSYNMFLVFSLS